MNPIQRRLTALEHSKKAVAIENIHPSEASVDELLYALGICERRIAGDPVSDDELAELGRVKALVNPRSFTTNQAIRIEEEFARMKQLGWLLT